MIFVNTAFQNRMQNEAVDGLVELIQVQGSGVFRLWTTSNQELYATLSGTLREYIPFPGRASGRIEASTDLTVATMEFMFAVNSGDNLRDLINANQLDAAEVIIERVFVDTPDLGRFPVYRGSIADFAWNRQGISGQARNVFDSFRITYPYYSYGDGCAWRFGSPGCGFNTQSVTITVPASNILVSSCSRIGLWMNVQTQTDAYFDFGRVTFTNGANSGQIRTVRDHTGHVLLLSHALPFNVVSGDTFQLYPGCRKRLVADCTSKFNNASAYLGFQWIPIPEQMGIGE